MLLFAKSARYYFDHSAAGRHKNVYHSSVKYGNSTINQLIHKSGMRWANNIDGIPAHNRCSVWTVPTRSFKGTHFATFSPDLIHPCIEAGCPPNGVVLDPFMGTGTTALIAKELDRNYVGIELNSDYVRLAEERLGE